VTNTLESILFDMGIEVVPTNAAAGNMQTHAGQILLKIFKRHGQGHLIMVLRTITESAGNQRALKSPIILAISDLLRTQPAWADRGLAWIEAFDDIDLNALMKQAQANRRAVPLREAICTQLFERLSTALGSPAKARRLRPATLAVASPAN